MNQFIPNITRLRKFRRRHPKGVLVNQSLYKFKYGLMAVTPGMIFDKHFEMIRVTVVNYFKRQSKPTFRMMPNVSYTTKPADVRRGRGKGTIEGWYFYAKKGKIMFEFNSPTIEQAKDIAYIINSKLPIKARLVDANDLVKINKDRLVEIKNNPRKPKIAKAVSPNSSE